jgi:hypothetical protein
MADLEEFTRKLEVEQQRLADARVERLSLERELAFAISRSSDADHPAVAQLDEARAAIAGRSQRVAELESIPPPSIPPDRSAEIRGLRKQLKALGVQLRTEHETCEGLRAELACAREAA